MKLKPEKTVVDAWVDSTDNNLQTDKQMDSVPVTEVVRESWYTYSGSTTLHCICHLSNKEYPWRRRVLWLLLFIGLNVAFVIEIKKLVQRFLEYQTVTKQATLYDNEPIFPAVTICNLNKIDNTTVTDPETRRLLLHAFMFGHYDKTYFETVNSSFVESVNLTEYFIERQWNSSLNAAYCGWHMIRKPCEEYFNRVLTDDGVCEVFNSRKFLNEDELFKSKGIGSEYGLIVSLLVLQEKYFIGDTAAAGFKVVIHDQEIEPSVKEVGFVISPGTATMVGVHKQEMNYLPDPVKAFGEASCIDIKDNGFTNYLKYYDEYSIEACLMECETDHTLEHCGCKHVLQPGNNRTCNAYEHMTCVAEAKANFSANGLQSCNCVFPCKYVKYNLKISNAWYPRDNFAETFFPNITTTDYLRKNLVELRIFYESKFYTQQVQVLELPLNDVYGALGGMMGLCFGASIGTVAEFLEFVINTFLIMFWKRRNLPKNSEK